jgi:hypothetical protein
VLEAALWLHSSLEPVIARKLHDRNTKIASAVNTLVERTSDPRLAGFVLTSLTSPDLRVTTARAIGRSQDPHFLQAVLDEAWLLADPEIERGCRWIRDGLWLQVAAGVLSNPAGSAAFPACRLLAAIGGAQRRKAEFLRELIGAGGEDIRRAILWRLIQDKTEFATDLLTTMAARPGDGVARMAEREVRRRRRQRSLASARPDPDGTYAPQQEGHDEFHAIWQGFDGLGPEHQSRAVDSLRRNFAAAERPLRAKMNCSAPLDRARALRIVSALGFAKRFDDEICHLAHDTHPIVRSLAVSLLGELPGPTTPRILRLAVNDPDERVQANAIEAYDRLDMDERIAYTRPKLDSTACRVRANAVKSLLRVGLSEAGETLLGMLEDPSRAHRLSALWVIERLQLRTVVSRVRAIGQRDADVLVRQRATRVLDQLSGHGDGGGPLSDRAPARPEVRLVGGQ